jgi:hypothetical protein
MKYTTPEIALMAMVSKDVITVSGENGNENGDIETPWD